MLEIDDGLQLIQHRMPVKRFLLPPEKQLPQLHCGLQAIILTISRDAFNIAMAMDRLESPDNQHARHLVIDRDGQIYQFADLLQPITQFASRQDTRPINNYNTLSIEIINAGKIFTTHAKRIIMHSQGSYPYSHSIARENIRNYYHPEFAAPRYYEALYHSQYTTLENLLRQLRQLFPQIRVLDCAGWLQLHQYRLPPTFPLRRLLDRR